MNTSFNAWSNLTNLTNIPCFILVTLMALSMLNGIIYSLMNVTYLDLVLKLVTRNAAISPSWLLSDFSCKLNNFACFWAWTQFSGWRQHRRQGNWWETLFLWLFLPCFFKFFNTWINVLEEASSLDRCLNQCHYKVRQIPCRKDQMQVSHVEKNIVEQSSTHYTR